jgi:PAS domain S-box-containing protein
MKKTEESKILLNVLCLEDIMKDAELLKEMLADAGYKVVMDIATGEKEYLSFLEGGKYDIILSDYTLPGFEAPAALKFALELQPEVPFICVSGTIGEDKAVELLKQGAADYVLKDRLGRLAFAVRRALAGVEQQKERQKAESETTRLLHELEVHQIELKQQNEELLLANEQTATASEKYIRLYNFSPSGHFTFNRKGEIIELNPRGSLMINNERSKLNYSKFSYFISSDTKPRFNLFLAKVFSSHARQTCEVNLVTNDNLPMCIQLSGIADESGDHCYVTATDITERKQAEEYLRESESRFKQISENSQELIWEVDINGLFTYASPVIEDLLGYKPEEIVGKKHFYDLFDEENREELKDAALSAFVSKKSFKDFVNINLHKAGQKIILSTTGIPMVDSLGNLIGYRGVDVDITEQTHSNESLRKSEYEFHMLAESMPQIVWITNADGWNTYCNQQWVEYTGQTLEESKGPGWSMPLHPDDLQFAIDAWQNAIENGATYSIEGRLRRFDGIYKWWLIRGIPILDTNGTVLKWFGTCTDINEIKLVEAELIIAKEHAEESDRLKSAFLANMSHEIRTPLNGILGFAELLKTPELSGEQQQEYIRIIKKSGDRMLNIINDIVDISKIEAGLMEVNIKESNINEQIEYIYTFFKPEVEGKGMQFFFKNTLPTKEAILKTDREKVTAIFINLVKNAIKFSDKGSIGLGYEKKGKYVEFFVTDTGIGIPKDRQEAIFNRFVQADICDRRAFQGAGLGLSISKAYVEMLGGKIRVQSEEGKGSTFYFTIPYTIEEQTITVINNIVPAEVTEDHIKKLKILIAEDDQTSEMLISLAVKIYSKEILTVTTGNDAVEICRNTPDLNLIFMDIKMLGMNGYEATRQIRQFNKDVVIIAQTAFGQKGDREKAIAAGCDDYISKPTSLALLKGIVRKHFQNK